VEQPVIGLVPLIRVVFTSTAFGTPTMEGSTTGGVHEVQLCAAIGFTIAITKIILIHLNKFAWTIANIIELQ
jgi:hypothetical protein